MSTNAVDIQIFGRLFRLNCPAEQQADLCLAAEEVNRRMQELRGKSKVTSSDQLIFIVALNVCFELAESQKKQGYQIDQFIERTQLLLQNIETALTPLE